VLAEEVGIGKTVEWISPLLFLSNQRHEAVGMKEKLLKALLTLVLMPEMLIEQWRNEITKRTDRFNAVLYYGSPKKHEHREGCPLQK